MVEVKAERVPHARLGTVERVERLTPHMVRVVLGGEALADLPVGEHTDAYVKLLFPPQGAPYAVPFDLEAVRRDLPRAQWPSMRTYTVRDHRDGRLTLDFVVHGDEGLAGPWADNVQPGDQVQLVGPGGGYAPDPSAPWHLFVGDESVIPAIAASLERLPAGVPAYVFVEVDGPDEEQTLPGDADLHVTWVHRDPARRTLLVDTVAAADLPDGVPQAFVHGEAGAVRGVRRWLRQIRKVPAESMSVSGYWSMGRTDEGWRAEKGAWKAAVAEDDATLA